MIVIDFLKKFDVHSFLIIGFLLLVREFCTPDEMPATVGVDFEVHGKVQGVFFRKKWFFSRNMLSYRSRVDYQGGSLSGSPVEAPKFKKERENYRQQSYRNYWSKITTRSLYSYTEAKARELGLHGWCMNTKQGTVLGYLEGDKCKIEEMKTWLQRTGSPQSAIDKAEFQNERQLGTPTLDKFFIKK